MGIVKINFVIDYLLMIIKKTVIAHSGAGYDNKFILQYCLTKGIVPSAFIRQGSRITYMIFKRFRIRFIDSYHFLYSR